MDVKQLNKIMKLYTLKALWDGQGKIQMYYGMGCPGLKSSYQEKSLLGKWQMDMKLEH